MLGVAIIITLPASQKPSCATEPRWHKETLDRLLSSETDPYKHFFINPIFFVLMSRQFQLP